MDGKVVLITGKGRDVLWAGDCAGFPAKSWDGYHFINKSDEPATLRVAGSRDNRDECGYAAIDMHLDPGRHEDAPPP